MAYQEADERRREAVLDELTREAQGQGDGYDSARVSSREDERRTSEDADEALAP